MSNEWDGRDRRNGYTVDPYEFGQLVGTVKSLAASVEALSKDVRSLLETRSTSKGILAGLAMVGGGVGALAHKAMESLFK